MENVLGLWNQYSLTSFVQRPDKFKEGDGCKFQLVVGHSFSAL
jgi:hypothetical protein